MTENKEKIMNEYIEMHKDIKEVHQTELDDELYNLRERHTEDDTIVGLKTMEGLTIHQFLSAFPSRFEDEHAVIFRSANFFTGAYYSKIFMLAGIYNFFRDNFNIPQENLDVVIAVDENYEPKLEIKHWDNQEWIQLEEAEISFEPDFDINKPDLKLVKDKKDTDNDK